MKLSKREHKKLRIELVKLVAPEMVRAYTDSLNNKPMAVLGVAEKTTWLADEIIARMIYKGE